MLSRYKLNKNQTTVTGRAIMGVITTLSNLGPYGQKVIDSLGETEIKLDKRYPFEMRTDIFEQIYSQYGSVSLLACGYNMRGLWPAMDKKLNSFVKKLKKDLVSVRDRTRSERALEKIIIFFAEVNSEALKEATSSTNGIAYGASARKTDENTFEYRVTQASKLRYEAYIRGNVEFNLQERVAQYWEISMNFDEEKSKEGDDWAEYVWIIKVKSKKSTKTSTEINTEKILEIRNDLVNIVLTHADKLKSEAEAQKNKVEALSNQLGKYMPPQIHNAIFSDDYDVGIATKRKKLSIFFSDIVNFTATSEGLQPEDLTKYLNEYFSEMTTIALDAGATIDKYIGDAMMVFFGDPRSRGEREDARSCVDMALKMQERMVHLQSKWQNEGFADPFKVRIGINTGYCNVGNFGSEQRLTYTIIGGEVNVAQRLEANADANGILLSYETFAHAQDMIEVEERDAIKMKGINRNIKSFSVIKRKLNGVSKRAPKVEALIKKKGSSEDFDVEEEIKTLKRDVRKLNEKIEKLL